MQPIPVATDNPNVNILRMGGDIVALTESPWQSILDGGDLRPVSRVAYDDPLGESAFMLAHPIVEGTTVTNLAFRLGRNAKVSLYTHAALDRSRQVRGTWTTPELPYLHSFGLTDRTAIIAAHPFTARPASLLWSNAGFIDHFRWRPERGSRFVLVDRESGAIREAETGAFFTFHVVQAFESGGSDGGNITIDLLAYDDPSIIERLATSALVRELPSLNAHLTRFTIHKKTLRVERRRLCDLPFEFPHLDFKLARGRSAATVYGASFVYEGGRLKNQVVAIDTGSGKTQRFSDEAWTFGEPVFVGRPSRTREGDGVLLVLGQGERSSQIFVLDATTLDPLATARFDVAFPLGFHGSFARVT
jgi:carotenoid cleavage dioxygenase-like enzyme